LKYLPFIAFILLFFSCLRKDSFNGSQKESLIYEYKTYEFKRNADYINTYGFKRNSDYLNRFKLTKSRSKYDKTNDSTISIIAITDSLKDWDSTRYRLERDTNAFYPIHRSRLRSLWSKEDTILSHFKLELLYDTSINERTKIIFINVGGNNDTLKYECKKEYDNLNIYSFFCSSCKALDSGYNIYLCDSIGVIAIFSGPWNILSILNKIDNSNVLNSRLQKIKYQLLNDTVFFPLPFECFKKEKVVYIPASKN
jgi:hypothetical protein